MGDFVEEFAALIGWEVDSKELETFDQQVASIGKDIKRFSAILAGATVALTALTVATNAQTSVNTQLARSLGVSAAEMETWGYLLGAIGFNTKKVTRLFKDLNSKIGGLKAGTQAFTIYQEAAKSVGLELEHIMELAPEEQFRAILQAAKDTEDSQTGIAAATAFLGSEAGKVVGYLRTQSGTVDEIMEKQAQMNLLTDSARDGAIRLTGAMDNLSAITESAKAQFFGLAGEALAPLVEKFNDWVALNSEVIKADLARWGDRLGRALNWVGTQIKWFVAQGKKLVDLLGGTENVLKMVAILMGAAFGAKVVLAIMAVTKAMVAAKVAALALKIAAMGPMLAVAAVIALFALLGEDLYQFFTGGESALGRVGERISDFLHENVKPTIADFFGMTPEEFDLATVRFVDGIVDFFTVTIPSAIDTAATYLADFAMWLTDHLPGYLEFLWGYWSTVWSAMTFPLQTVISWIKNMGGAFVQFFQDVFSGSTTLTQALVNLFQNLMTGFVNFVTGIPNEVIRILEKSVNGIRDLLKQVPLIGEKIGGGKIEIPRIPTPSVKGSLGSLGASLGARTAAQGAGGQAGGLGAVTASQAVTNTFNITQSAGESGEGFAKRVAGVMEKNMGRAVKVTGSGVEY